MSIEKEHQTPGERAEINEKAVEHLKDLLKELPVEVLGHLESRAVCCGNGTVALVKVELGDRPPRTGGEKP